MSVDTRARLKGHIEPELILDFIKNKYDSNAKLQFDVTNYGNINNFDFKIKEYYGNDNNWLIISGNIFFEYKNNKIDMFYYYNNINVYEHLKYYSEYGLSDMIKTETTSLILYQSDLSIQIIKDIVEEFGGWLDENDCDDVSYYYVEKNSKYYDGKKIKYFDVRFGRIDIDDKSILFNPIVITIEDIYELIESNKIETDDRVIYINKKNADNLNVVIL